jgi:hypothetical protein
MSPAHISHLFSSHQCNFVVSSWPSFSVFICYDLF